MCLKPFCKAEASLKHLKSTDNNTKYSIFIIKKTEYKYVVNLFINQNSDMDNLINKSKAASLKVVSNAIKNLSIEDRQLLKLKFFSNDAFEEMKAFEKKLKNNQKPINIDDREIVDMVKLIRKRRNASV